MLEIDVAEIEGTEEQKKDWRYTAMSIHQALCSVGFELQRAQAGADRVDRIIYAAKAIGVLLKAHGIDPFSKSDVEGIMGNRTIH